MRSTIPKQFSISREGKGYRGAYSLKDGIVTVSHSRADGLVRQMLATAEGLKAIVVARTILRDLA